MGHGAQRIKGQRQRPGRWLLAAGFWLLVSGKRPIADRIFWQGTNCEAFDISSGQM